ncbi:energy transducer TonB [Metallibacterium sp.]|uniref:energy transducer TonB n=1 Tax=Metallibacterium sp. TaxID=2940281 RepID=UPI0026253DA4|nr:energy transducer TonB [Metallibacterium sp.]
MAIESVFPRANTRFGAAAMVALLCAALAACSGSNQSAPQAAKAPVAPAKAASTSAKPASVAPNAADRLTAMSVDQLMDHAQKALKEDRLVAPAGDNAFEYYLAVLHKSPNNRAAQDALRETFPYGAQTVDQTINQGNYAEAQREIDLLAKADPTNYTLTILRSKLDAARKVATQQQQARKAAALAQTATAAAAAAQRQQQEQAAAALKQRQEQAATAAALQQQQEQQAAAAAAAQKATVVKAPAQTENRNAQVVRQVPAKYPLQAARNGEQGWVDVAFTVNPDGSVSNAHVTDAEPRRVFDRAAIDAVSRWRFKPALINGRPTAVVVKRRIEFKLSGNG